MKKEDLATEFDGTRLFTENDGTDVSAQKDYWLKVFEDEVPMLSLAHQTKGKTHSGRREQLRVSLPCVLADNVRGLAAKNGLTAYAVMLSAFYILLKKYAAQEDFVVGLPNPDGVCGESAETLDFLAVRGQPEKNKSVQTFLSETEENLTMASRNRAVSLRSLMGELQRKNILQADSLFDVIFVMQDSNDSFGLADGSVLDDPAFRNAAASTDFVWILTENSQKSYDVTIDYASDWFDASLMGAMAGTFQRILEAVTRDAEAVIGALDVISDEDRALILGEFNATDSPYDRTLTIIDAFQKYVKESPDSVAVKLGSSSLTYAQLDQKSNQIARVLLESGIDKGEIIGLIGNRSLLTIAGMLGIMKAGGAYLPIDPTYPKDRVEFMLEDSGARMLLTDEGELPAAFGGKVIRMNEMDGTDDSAVDVKLVPNDLAYVIYTSGTTGKPKGVLLEHKGVINLTHCYGQAMDITRDDVMLQFANMAFDASVWEIFNALLNGAAVCLVTRDIIDDIKAFEEYVKENGVTIASFPPQYYLQLGDVSFKLVLTAGSETNEDVIRKATKDGIYINGYGPTENTVSATFWKIDHFDDTMTVNIGRPMHNAKVFIMDGMTLCGIGMPGELCITGSSLARGYLNRPALTDEKFVDNPFGEGKMYRTGDLARWLPDGTIAFMGRIDHQVKIRGFRIELGEIEETIRKQPGINDAAVIVAADESGSKTIFAYVVSSERVDVRNLRQEIAKTLPGYMVPTGIMQIEKIPLTPNGKLNKNALPKMEESGGDDMAAPVNELQRFVLDVWKKCLNKEGIGIRSMFFEVGGDSLNMLTVIAELKKQGFDVKVKDLQDYPTVEQLCSEILGKQDVELVLEEPEELVIEKYDNYINAIVSYYDNLTWDDYDCFYRPISIIGESFCRDYFDIIAMMNSFYTVYNFGNMFDFSYLYGNHQVEESGYLAFFGKVLEEKLGIRMEKFTFSSPEQMHGRIKEAIDKQCPVLVPIDPITLVYAPHYNLFHDNHYVIIKGYDSQRERYIMLDNLQLDNGTSTVYNDFFISYATLYDSVKAMSALGGDPNEGYFYLFSRTDYQNAKSITANDALHELITMLSAMENGTVPYIYLEEDALHTISSMLDYFRTHAFSDMVESKEPRLQMIYQLYLWITLIYKYQQHDEITQLLYAILLGIETNINQKNTFFKSLNSLLKKCNVDDARINAVLEAEQKLTALWLNVKQFIFMLTNREEVPEAEIAMAVSEAKQQESVFRKTLIGMDETIRQLQMSVPGNRKAQAEASKRGYFVENINDAKIEFIKDDIRIELDSEKLYSLWSNEDNAVKIGKYVRSENWEVSTTISVEYTPEENRFQDGLVVYLEKSSKLLYGIVVSDVSTILVELHCPELGNDYLLLTFKLPSDIKRVSIRVRKVADNLSFEYFDISKSDWICAKTIVQKSKVERVALVSRDWFHTNHTAYFSDIQFSW